MTFRIFLKDFIEFGENVGWKECVWDGSDVSNEE